MNAAELRRVGATDLQITRLGMGCASFGGLYAPVTFDVALETLRAGWAAGIRYFDTAPMYGMGRSEHILGHFLREEADGPAAISSKVGRLMTFSRPGRMLPPEPPKNPLDPGWHNGLPFREQFDYSYDGVMRSFDDSLQRTGLGRIDILYVHDIGRLTHAELHEKHWAALTGGGFRALEELRSAGLISAIGLGVNEPEVIEAVMDEVRLDCTLLAGRHTLLEQNATALLDRAAREGMAVVVGGVFNSGILAAATGGHRKYNYADVPAEVAARVDRLTAACAAHGVAMPAAAIQFPFRHKGVTSVLMGANKPAQVAQNLDWFHQPVPAALWDDLAEQGLIAAEA